MEKDIMNYIIIKGSKEFKKEDEIDVRDGYLVNYIHNRHNINLKELLDERYNNKKILDELFSLGNIAKLQPTIKKTIFYSRDGGDPLNTCDVDFYEDIDDFLNNRATKHKVFYFDGNKWFEYVKNDGRWELK